MLHGMTELLLVASSTNSGIVVLLLMAAPPEANGSSVSGSASGLDIGQTQLSEGDGRLLVGSWGLFFFRFPLRQARLYVQWRPLLRQRSHSGFCLGHTTLSLAHVSQLNLSFCFEVGVRGCATVECDVVDDIVLYVLLGLLVLEFKLIGSGLGALESLFLRTTMFGWR